VDKRGQSVSATDFAALTGISRERLRTWERRFGFPQPVRIGGGRRRYALADAGRVVAVRRAAEAGVPLARAIAEASDGAAEQAVSTAALAAVAADAPTPVVLVAGPSPLRVVYVNAPLQARAGGTPAGQELERLPWFLGSDLERTLRTLFAGDSPALECRHPAWQGGVATQRSIAYRLPAEPGDPPLVALVGIDRAEEHHARREVEELEHELVRLRGREQRLERWIGLTAALAERFQRDADDAVLSLVTSTMVRGVGAADAGIAVYAAGALALDRSSRGLLSAGRVTVTGFEDLAALMHAGRPGWLSVATGEAFGVPDDLSVLAVPIVVVGETLGLLLLVFEEQGELDQDARRLLTVVSAGLGFTLLRDLLVASGRRGAGAQTSS
jgi:DNA-binding transcriptional MerR regulator